MHLRKKILSVVLAGAMIGGELLTGIGSFSLNVSAADSSFAGEEWYDQIATVEENREPAHAYFTPYESAEKALTNEKSVLDEDASESAYKQSLNGTWKFKFAQKPADREKQAKGADAKIMWRTGIPQAGMISKFQVPSRRSRMQTAILNTKSRSM